jgi:hypothetical protein
MMVAIAYGMPFELDQFSLFHVSLHIDATSDTNKEGCPFVTVASKDSYDKNNCSLSFLSKRAELGIQVAVPNSLSSSYRKRSFDET